VKNLVIFDCDGVLVDSETLANKAFVDCLIEIQIQMTVEDAVKRFKGRKMADCLLEVEKLYSRALPKSFETTFRKRMSDYFESDLKPITDVEIAIKNISQIKCVASNGPLQKTKRNLEITGLIHHFGESIFSAYTIQKWKPEPELFLHACKEMGSAPKHSVVVEDSELGVQAACAGGFHVLAYGFKPSLNSEVVSFQHMSELPSLIDRLFMVA
jgi:HAD superfamily hydrolase (TIGR01509 family)